MREQLQPAYVLHRRPFRDSSELVDVFTAEQGRQTLVVRGVGRRRRGGSLGALLQPFQPLLLSYRGRGEMPTLTAAEAAGVLPALRGDALLSGIYLNELLLRLLPRYENHALIFVAYGNAIAQLSEIDQGKALEGILRRFEFGLLEELGYGVDLRTEADTGAPLDPGAGYRLVTQQGFFRINSPTSIGVMESATAFAGAAQSVDEERFPGDALLAIADGDYEDGRALVAKRLIRSLLHPHLGAAPLRSRRMFAASRPAAGGSS